MVRTAWGASRCTQKVEALPTFAYKKIDYFNGETKRSVQRGATHGLRTWMTVRGPPETGKRNGKTTSIQRQEEFLDWFLEDFLPRRGGDGGGGGGGGSGVAAAATGK